MFPECSLHVPYVQAFAAMLHRSHLLLLLARGLRFDRAADDALLQACSVSCVPLDVLEEIRNHTSSAAAHEALSPSALRPLVTWFYGAFRLVPDPEPNDEDLRAGEDPVRLVGGTVDTVGNYSTKP
jgi:hypothetical protein